MCVCVLFQVGQHVVVVVSYLAIITTTTNAGHLQVDANISMCTRNDLNSLKITGQYHNVATSRIRLHTAHRTTPINTNE